MEHEYVYTERFFQYELKPEDFYDYEKFKDRQVEKLTALKMARNNLEKYDYNKSRMGQARFIQDILSKYGINSKEDIYSRCRFKTNSTHRKILLVFIDDKYIGAFIFKEEVVSKLDGEYTEMEYTIKFIKDYKENKYGA